MLALQGFAAAVPGKMDLKAIGTGFGKHTFANLYVQRQQFVVLLEGGGELHVTDEPIASLVDDENLAGIPALARAERSKNTINAGGKEKARRPGASEPLAA